MNKLRDTDWERSELNYRWENEALLLDFVKKQLGITEDDIKKQGIVKEKIRNYNIDKVLEK